MTLEKEITKRIIQISPNPPCPINLQKKTEEGEKDNTVEWNHRLVREVQRLHLQKKC